MKRVIKFECGTIDELNAKKYILQKEYDGFGVYQEMCPSGFYHHQSWLIANDKVALVCESYNNYCKEELLDMIDTYNQKNKFGIKGFHKSFVEGVSIYIAHPNYKETI